MAILLTLQDLCHVHNIPINEKLHKWYTHGHKCIVILVCTVNAILTEYTIRTPMIYLLIIGIMMIAECTINTGTDRDSCTKDGTLGKGLAGAHFGQKLQTDA